MSQKEREAFLIDALHHLDQTDQEKLVAFATELWGDATARPMVKGASLSDLRDVIGILPHEDAEEMRAIIEEGCENIDPNWNSPSPFDQAQ
jgi:hypothetical protein